MVGIDSFENNNNSNHNNNNMDNRNKKNNKNKVTIRNDEKDSLPQILIFKSLYLCNTLSQTLNIPKYEFCSYKLS